MNQATPTVPKFEWQHNWLIIRAEATSGGAKMKDAERNLFSCAISEAIEASGRVVASQGRTWSSGVVECTYVCIPNPIEGTDVDDDYLRETLGDIVAAWATPGIMIYGPGGAEWVLEAPFEMPDDPSELMTGGVYDPWVDALRLGLVGGMSFDEVAA